MKSISSTLTIEKNRIATENPWLVLLDITLTDGVTKFSLVANTEDIQFQGRTYTAMPFNLIPPKESSKGEIPTVTLEVCNVTRVIQGYLEALDGAIGSGVVMRIVNAAYLAEDYAELEMEFEVLAAKCNAQWVSFTLGAPSPLQKRFPLYRYIAMHCKWVQDYKGAECKYSGPLPDCKGTLDDCRAHGNSRRFGGEPGLSGGGVRLV
ncbi:DUF1833 family protein [Geobacter sp.]|uniref:DUF1833 family protein n=1 Tax=Geobacter sp. TaxID=46610 RepID=UPI002602566E|nr:DUF1833 family protein [Geobacter sp.]